MTLEIFIGIIIMVNNAPKSFLTICKMAGFSEDKIQFLWIDVWEKTISGFLEWLIKDLDLNNEQLQKLEELFLTIENRESKQSILASLELILSEGQMRLAAEKFAGLFTVNLDNFYTNLRSKMNMEQKQVVDSFIKLTNV